MGSATVFFMMTATYYFGFYFTDASQTGAVAG